MVIRPSIRARLERLIAKQRARMKVELALSLVMGLPLFVWFFVHLSMHGRGFYPLRWTAFGLGLMLLFLAGERQWQLRSYDRRPDFLKDPDPIQRFEIVTHHRWNGAVRVLSALPLQGPRLRFPLPKPKDEAFEKSFAAEMTKLLEDDEHSVLA